MKRIRHPKDILDRIAKDVPVSNGDIIVIKAGSVIADKNLVSQLRAHLAATGRDDVLIVVAEQLDDLQRLNPESMVRYGWVRKETRNAESAD